MQARAARNAPIIRVRRKRRRNGPARTLPLPRGERVDSLDPDTFKYRITAREIPA